MATATESLTTSYTSHSSSDYSVRNAVWYIPNGVKCPGGETVSKINFKPWVNVNSSSASGSTIYMYGYVANNFNNVNSRWSSYNTNFYLLQNGNSYTDSQFTEGKKENFFNTSSEMLIGGQLEGTNGSNIFYTATSIDTQITAVLTPTRATVTYNDFAKNIVEWRKPLYFCMASNTTSALQYTKNKTFSADIIYEGTNIVNYYDGSKWVQCQPYYYNGSSWVPVSMKYYDGSWK